MLQVSVAVWSVHSGPGSVSTALAGTTRTANKIAKGTSDFLALLLLTATPEPGHAIMG